jgi:hypothetical protein
MDPLEAGEKVLRGIRRNDFHIMPHPEFREEFREAFDEIIAALPDGSLDPGRELYEEQCRRHRREARQKVAAYVFSNARRILVVTGLVINNPSASRGDATNWMPKRPKSQKGVPRALLSASQALQSGRHRLSLVGAPANRSGSGGAGSFGYAMVRFFGGIVLSEYSAWNFLRWWRCHHRSWPQKDRLKLILQSGKSEICAPRMAKARPNQL